MDPHRLLLQRLSSICIILLCGEAVRAQVPPPQYGFVSVNTETGAPAPDSVVVVYNGSGVEIHRQITGYEGKLFVHKWIKDKIILEQKESLKNNSSCVIRVLKSGYQTYEAALEGDLSGDGVFIIDTRRPRGATGIKITLSPRPKSKIGGVRMSPGDRLALRRPP